MKKIFMAGMAVLMLAAAGCGSGGPEPAGNFVTGIAPADGATGVPVTQVITTTFSKDLDQTTLTAANITLTRGAPIGGTNIPGEIIYDAGSFTLSFTPDIFLSPGTLYTFQIGAGATTKAEGDYAITFTTQEAPILYGYAADPATSPADLWSMHPDGSSQTNLTAYGTKAAGSLTVPFAIAWSPDFTRVAFTAETGDPSDHTDLFVMNADGSSRINLTNGAAHYAVQKLRWAPDGSRIYFQFEPDDSTVDTYANIASINPDGTGFLNVTNLPSTMSVKESFWQVSPDGAKLYYCAGGYVDGDPFDIYSISVDGTGNTNLTHMASGSKATTLQLSPDGTRLYYMGGSSAVGIGLYAMNVDGSAVQQVVAPVTGRAPMPLQVSPDGTQLIIRTIDTGPPQIWNVAIVNTDGSGTIPLTSAAGTNMAITGNWSPDSSRVAYIFGDPAAGPVDLYVANRDGTGVLNLTNYAAGTLALDQFNFTPDIVPGCWSPDGTQIVASQTTAGPQMRVVRENHTDGSGVTVFTNTTLPQQALFGAWW